MMTLFCGMWTFGGINSTISQAPSLFSPHLPIFASQKFVGVHEFLSSNHTFISLLAKVGSRPWIPPTATYISKILLKRRKRGYGIELARGVMKRLCWTYTIKM
jgi:hypothetical protein